jgi:hypothetical protein
MGVVKNWCYFAMRSWHEVLFSHLGYDTPYSNVRLLLTFIANCLQNHKKLNFWSIARPQNGVLQFLRNLSISDYMLLHNTNINVAIAHILMGRNELYNNKRHSKKNSEVRNRQK